MTSLLLQGGKQINKSFHKPEQAYTPSQRNLLQKQMQKRGENSTKPPVQKKSQGRNQTINQSMVA
jgi:hypothetical protein